MTRFAIAAMLLAGSVSAASADVFFNLNPFFVDFSTPEFRGADITGPVTPGDLFDPATGQALIGIEVALTAVDQEELQIFTVSMPYLFDNTVLTVIDPVDFEPFPGFTVTVPTSDFNRDDNTNGGLVVFANDNGNGASGIFTQNADGEVRFGTGGLVDAPLGEPGTTEELILYRTVFAVDPSFAGDLFFNIVEDPTVGSLTYLVDVTDPNDPANIISNPPGVILPTTGFDVGLDSIVTVVPEPSSIALAGLGVAGLAVALRRRNG